MSSWNSSAPKTPLAEPLSWLETELSQYSVNCKTVTIIKPLNMSKPQPPIKSPWLSADKAVKTLEVSQPVTKPPGLRTDSKTQPEVTQPLEKWPGHLIPNTAKPSEMSQPVARLSRMTPEGNTKLPEMFQQVVQLPAQSTEKGIKPSEMSKPIEKYQGLTIDPVTKLSEMTKPMTKTPEQTIGNSSKQSPMSQPIIKSSGMKEENIAELYEMFRPLIDSPGITPGSVSKPSDMPKSILKSSQNKSGIEPEPHESSQSLTKSPAVTMDNNTNTKTPETAQPKLLPPALTTEKNTKTEISKRVKKCHDQTTDIITELSEVPPPMTKPPIRTTSNCAKPFEITEMPPTKSQSTMSQPLIDFPGMTPSSVTKPSDMPKSILKSSQTKLGTNPELNETSLPFLKSPEMTPCSGQKETEMFQMINASTEKSMTKFSGTPAPSSARKDKVLDESKPVTIWSGTTPPTNAKLSGVPLPKTKSPVLIGDEEAKLDRSVVSRPLTKSSDKTPDYRAKILEIAEVTKSPVQIIDNFTQSSELPQVPLLTEVLVLEMDLSTPDSPSSAIDNDTEQSVLSQQLTKSSRITKEGGYKTSDICQPATKSSGGSELAAPSNPAVQTVPKAMTDSAGVTTDKEAFRIY